MIREISRTDRVSRTFVNIKTLSNLSKARIHGIHNHLLFILGTLPKRIKVAFIKETD